MKKKIFKTPPQYFAIVISIVGIIIASYILYPVLKQLVINSDLYKEGMQEYKDRTWVEFRSNRVNFSFQHPLSWPVAAVPDNWYGDINKFDDTGEREVENIDFQEYWERNAGGDRFGYISVKEIKGINSLEDYIKRIDNEGSVYSPRCKCRITVSAPTITKIKIAGEDAITITQSDEAQFSTPASNYIIVKNGLVYSFAAVTSSRFMKDYEENLKVFQKLVSSARFY